MCEMSVPGIEIWFNWICRACTICKSVEQHLAKQSADPGSDLAFSYNLRFGNGV